MSDKKIYIDGSGLVLGRLSSWIAQELMAGQQIIVVNSEKIIVSGRRRFLIEDRLQKRARATHTNPTRGPFYPRFPDRILRRTVRGMLPWKKSTGRNAYKNLQAFIETPKHLEGKNFISVKAASTTPTGEFHELGNISRSIGWTHGMN
jgi:large subunit ribosomal protein L13